MKRLNLFVALCVIFVGLNSCKKDEPSASVDEISLSQQETQAEEALDETDLVIDEAIYRYTAQLKSASTGNFAYLNDCPVITSNLPSMPQVITIDFGTSCTGSDGKTRSGKIIIISDSFSNFPSVREKAFDNFMVDGIKIQGNAVKTINKYQENNIRIAQIHEDVTITFPEIAGTARRVADLTRLYQKNGLLNPLDNQVAIWGTVEFTRISGKTLTKTIAASSPLLFKVACDHIVSGTISVTTSNNRSWSIDYGNGDCDNKATLTMGEKSREIRIH